ncbi:uncharacterized protein LOC129906867 [Episyrphus balteatus]|uniref:uncharacterized protein LOC129906867 n=1 Tax=Episyrphus balteatus TaxID=286459 RepID=UPI0024862D60|nr:uncharacterized protein LOC129906867 [Episyrphus balteatus]
MVVLKWLMFLFLKELLATQAESLLPEVVNYALANSFNNTADELNIVIETDFDENNAFFLDTINIILKENWNFRLQIHINNEAVQKCGDFNLWFIGSYKAFGRLLPWIRANHRDSQLYYFIVFKNSATKMLYINDIEKIFSDFLLLMVANVNVIIETDSNEVLFYTFFPYQKNACRSTKPLITHRFSDTSFNIEKPFFPSKADNFCGCPLRVITKNELIVNMAKDNEPNTLENYEMSILEVIMLKEFASRMNFKPEIYESVDLNIFDSELPITNGKIDVLLAYMASGPMKNYLYSKTVPYYLSWMVIAVNPQLNTFRTQAWILAPFNLTTWIYILASLSLITGGIILINTRRFKRFFNVLRQHDNQLGGLDIISLVIGTSIQHLPNKIWLRFSLIAFSLGALVIRTVYLGKIYDAFRGQVLLIPPRSIKELFAENYTILTYPYFKSIIDDLNGIEYQNIQYLLQSTKSSEMFEDSEKMALVTTFVHIYTFFSAKERSKLMMEGVLREQMCIFFQKHSFILPKINEITMKMEQAGILNYFRKGFEKINNPQLEGDLEPKPLGLESFAYIIYAAIILNGISLLVFIFELLWHSINKI